MIEQDPRECDVVLEGGVTSAVIYAGLLARLSRVYRFRCLGGTSAGAVAAAAAAIAERSRIETGKRLARDRLQNLDAPPIGDAEIERQKNAAFDALEQFPKKLAEVDAQGRTVLFKLFQAQPATRRGYRVIAAALSHGGGGVTTKAVGIVCAAVLRNFPLAAFIGALPGLWFVVDALRQLWQRSEGGPGWAWVTPLVSLVVGIVLAAVLALASAFVWGLLQTLRGMLANHFGLCNGMPAPGHEGEALTPTLHALYNGLLGRAPGERPVVFGELWGQKAEREIDLQMITTAIDLSRPLRLPNEPGVDPLRNFFYDPQEWDELFPPVVMSWLREHPRAGGAQKVKTQDGRELAALPEPHHWPVVMAVRLSLSFPGLLSAMPMYTLDARHGVHKVDAEPGNVAFVADKIRFSDGGITSNCPIHLFDSPLPLRPTFGVNLWRLPEGARHSIWMHGDREAPDMRRNIPTSNGTLARAFDYVAAIVGTAIDWRDSVQRALPGYRERIVHIGLPPNEGGLNLAMPSTLITALSATGAKAADRLIEEFTRSRAAPNTRLNTWDLHRWVRMRSTLAATRQHLKRLCDRVSAGSPSFHQLPVTTHVPPPGFVDAAAAQQAQALMKGAQALMKEIDQASPAVGLEDNAPQPAPGLRMSSPW